MKLFNCLFTCISILISTLLPAQSNDVFYFVTDRYTQNTNTPQVFKARINNSGISSVLIKGHFEAKNNPNLKKAQITVYNASTDKLTGIYNTNPHTGNYILLLIPNVKYEFNIQVPGYAPFKKIVEIPKYASTKIEDEISAQKIILTENNNIADIVISNEFIEEPEPVLFLLTIYNENNKNQPYAQQLYDADEEEFKDFIEFERRELKETTFENVDELLEKENKEQAEMPENARKLFAKKNYPAAIKIYKQLLNLYPDNVEYNYNYALCLFNTGRETEAIPYFKNILSQTNKPKEVHYYLGRALHLKGDFETASEQYQIALKVLSPNESEKWQISKLLNQSNNGKTLISNQLNIDVISKNQTSLNKLTKYYPKNLVENIIIEKSDFFMSPIDKKKNEKFFMCKQGAVIIQPSYGIKDKGEKDLYFNTLIGNDKWSLTQALPKELQSSEDENYPYLTPDGLTLYFASKGFNSMGGYDIFKCTRESTRDPFSKPENLGYPINSPYDDILFIPDSTGEIAYFSSNRRQLNKQEFITHKVKLPQEVVPLAIIKGHFMTLDSIPSVTATITVINTNTQEIAGIYNTNPYNGKYLMALIPGIKYEIQIETENYKLHTAYMTIPRITEPTPLKQHLRLKKEGNFEILNVDNYFTPEQAENVTVDFDIPAINNNTENNLAKNTPKEDKTITKIRKPDSAQKQQLEQAVKLTKANKYEDAVKIFNKLYPIVDFTPIEAYYYAQCLENTEPEWNTITTLYELAGTSAQTPTDVYLKLAIANMNTYRFNKALKAIERYELVMRNEKLDLDKINSIKKTCEIGIKMSVNPKAMEILQVRDVKPEYLNTIYSSTDIQGKFIAAPEELISAIDKKNNYRPLIFLNKDRNIMYFASYGENEDFGKDLYIRRKLPDNTWSPAINLGYTINTKFDEEYPFVTDDGKTLYFASKGHNSIGGYDIFKATWNEKTNMWNEPQNIGLPINSTFNDYFYVE
jgi:tetratricopeptide (TPR) repeat protein